MSHATYQNEIDDGTDDNEVVDLQTAIEQSGMTPTNKWEAKFTIENAKWVEEFYYQQS